MDTRTCKQGQTNRKIRTDASTREDSLTYPNRFPEAEVLFKDILAILRANRTAVRWLTDQGIEDVDANPQFLLLKRALEKSLRNVAKSGSRLFKKKDITSRANWEEADPWRKHRCIIFLIRYLRCVCMCPYSYVHMSLRGLACVLILICMCPYSSGTS